MSAQDQAVAGPPVDDGRPRDRPLEDYALIGDMRGAALVNDEAGIDWLCLGRFDAAPAFLRLLDSEKGGACTVELDSPVITRRRKYVAGTNVLQTVLETATGTLVVTDFMPIKGIIDAGDVGADSVARHRLVRILRCESGTVGVTISMLPSFDWGRRQVAAAIQARSASFGDEAFAVAASHPLAAEQDLIMIKCRLDDQAAIAVAIATEIDPEPLTVKDATAWLADTIAYWTSWSAGIEYHGRHAEHVVRSALVLKLLTYAPTGAMIAAPTTALPESPGGERNWDYRFVWTRDASFSVSAFLNLGLRREAAEFLRFLHSAEHDGEVVRVMYGVDGPVLAEETFDHLRGWRASRPVMAGNAASDQKQHEIYGELLAALNLYVDRHGTEGLCPSLREDLPAFIGRLAEAAIKTWRTPDQGIWELRGDARHLLHSKAMCWVALDRADRLLRLLDRSPPLHWQAEREAVRDYCFDEGWNDDINAFPMEIGGTALDMSTLRLALMGLIAADDPKMTSTLAASEAELATGDLYHRYRFDDGLPGEEGAFLACSFWVVALYTLRGDHDAASAMLDRLLSRSNDVGLFSEEIEVSSGSMIGNYPQGFSHMAVIHELVRLTERHARNAR